jgi:hypothetical protein
MMALSQTFRPAKELLATQQAHAEWAARQVLKHCEHVKRLGLESNIPFFANMQMLALVTRYRVKSIFIEYCQSLIKAGLKEKFAVVL